MGTLGNLLKAWIKNDWSILEGLAGLPLSRSVIEGFLEELLKNNGIICKVKIKELKKDRHSAAKETYFYANAQILIEESELVRYLDNLWTL